MSFWGIAELNVTIYNIKTLSAGQKYCYGEFKSSEIIYFFKGSIPFCVINIYYN